jgi:hypothetical protein
VGKKKRRGRASSALLAVAGSVSAFCEVPFQLNDGRKFRTDGVITVQRGKTSWTLLVEVKTGTSELTQEQVEAYLEIVREQRLDGLLTISNQIVPSVNQHPVKVDGKRFGRVPLYHISWARILTVAILVKEYQGVSDPDQAWILGELIRYLEYDGSGALTFEDMGAQWPTIRNATRDQTVRLSDEGVRETAVRWDQLVQYLCLRLAARLGREVRPMLSKSEIENPESRVNAIVHELVDEGTLSGTIRIPNAVAPLHLLANLRMMTAETSIQVVAPDVKRPSARVNWLLRQLKNAPGDVRIDVAFLWARDTSSELLSNIIEDPKCVLSEANRQPKSFRLTQSRGVGAKRKSGEGSFIGDISALVDGFYRDVVQDLKPWTPPAPQLPRDEAQPSVPEEVDAESELVMDGEDGGGAPFSPSGRPFDDELPVLPATEEHPGARA